MSNMHIANRSNRHKLRVVKTVDSEDALNEAIDCVHSPDDGIGPAVRISQTVGFKIIKSKAVVVDEAVHHFTLIKVN